MSTQSLPARNRGHLKEKLSVTVPSAPRYLKGIRALSLPLCEDLGFPPEIAAQLCLALHEACCNVIEHACQGDPGKVITVEFWVGDDRLEMRVPNYCRRSDVPKIRPRRLDEIRPGGLGTHFMETLMDSVRYVPGDRGRMTLVLQKSRPRVT